MNKIKLSLCSVLFLVFGYASVYAYDFEVDGLYYNITGNKANPTCEVTMNTIDAQYDSKYSGSITIPESVTYQGVTFNVVSIGKKAFYYSKITDITIPKSVTNIGDEAFHNCSKLIHISNLENITELGKEAFWGCTHLESILIPNVETIPDFCFKQCTSLKEIVLDNTISIKKGAFNWCTNLSKIIAPKLISIEDQNVNEDDTNQVGGYYTGAFYNCAITELYLPNLERIGENSFSNCQNLEKVDLPKLKSFYVFANYYMPNGSSCGAFMDCEKLKYVNLPLVKDLWNATFKNCTSLETIELPNLQIIYKQTPKYSGAFQGCTNLKKIEINKYINNIPSKTFADCVNLKEIFVYNPIPPKVETDAFYNVSVLNCNVYVPYKKGELYASTDGWSSFWNITEMKSDIKAESVSITASVNNIVTDVSDSSITKCIGCEPFALYANVLPEDTGNNTVTWNSSNNSVANIDINGIVNIIKIGETTITATTTDGSNKSASCTLIVEKAISLKEANINIIKGDVCQLNAIISNGLSNKNIEWLSDNEKVAKVSSTGEVIAVDKGETIITAKASNGEIATCSIKVTSYDCGENLTWSLSENGTLEIKGSGEMYNYKDEKSVPWYENRDNIKTVIIADGVTSIKNYAFYGCSNLKSVDFKNAYVSIYSYAFGYCENLSNIINTSNITHIGSYAFERCCKLSSISDINNVETIGKGAFLECENIVSFEIPSKLINIDEYMFSGCINLKSIVIPNGVKRIGDFAFDYCTSLTSLSLPNSITSIGYKAFNECYNLENVNIPNSVDFIEYGAFEDCQSLKEISILGNVTKIEGSTFSGCISLEKVVLPITLKTIDEDAFESCTALRNIYCMARIAPKCNNDSFEGVNRMQCKLYVLEGCAPSYMSTNPWSEFFSINEWNPDAEKEVLINSITLSDTKLSLEVGETESLSAVIYPDNATNMTIKWTTTNPAIAMVDSNGNIYAVGEGTAIITASSTDGSEITAMCIVTVSVPNDIESISEGSSQITYYDMNGVKLSNPRKGINIMRTSNGVIRKVNIK